MAAGKEKVQSFSDVLKPNASRFGFRHMGTLAADYRALFGELPSETRRSVGELLPLPAPSRSLT